MGRSYLSLQLSERRLQLGGSLSFLPSNSQKAEQHRVDLSLFRIEREEKRVSVSCNFCSVVRIRIFVLSLLKITAHIQVHTIIPLPLPQRVNNVNFQCEHFFKARKDQNANKADTFAGGF